MDIGWSELLLIAIVALIVVGPKELPGLFKTVGQFMGRARGMAREFQRSMEQAAEESGLNEAAKSLKSVDRLNLNSATNSARNYAKSVATGGNATVDPPEPGATATIPADSDIPEPLPATKPAARSAGSDGVAAESVGENTAAGAATAEGTSRT